MTLVACITGCGTTDTGRMQGLDIGDIRGSRE